MLIDFLLRQQCVIRPWLGTAAGEQQLGPEESRAWRLQAARRLEQTAGLRGTADQIPAHAVLYCTGAPIAERSRVRCGEAEYVVIACRELEGWGEKYLEVLLQ